MEIYLIQGALFIDMMNGMFPFNIPIMFVIIVIGAYLLRCGARILLKHLRMVNIIGEGFSNLNKQYSLFL